MQPLSAGEDEPSKLKREEAERLEALKEPEIEVTKVCVCVCEREREWDRKRENRESVSE